MPNTYSVMSVSVVSSRCFDGSGSGQITSKKDAICQKDDNIYYMYIKNNCQIMVNKSALVLRERTQYFKHIMNSCIKHKTSIGTTKENPYGRLVSNGRKHFLLLPTATIQNGWNVQTQTCSLVSKAEVYLCTKLIGWNILKVRSCGIYCLLFEVELGIATLQYKPNTTKPI